MFTPAYYRCQLQTSLGLRARLRSSDRKPRQNESILSLVKSLETVPIDMPAFGKTLSEIITKSVSASRKRQKSRK